MAGRMSFRGARRVRLPLLLLFIWLFSSSVSSGSTSQTITFDALTPNQFLIGQYPVGVAEWGNATKRLVSGPYGLFTGNSISLYSGFSGSFTFVVPRRLISLDAYNGDTTGPTTVTLSCAGLPDINANVGPAQRLTIATSWTSTCVSVTISSTNGSLTNLANLVHDAGTGPTISNVQASGISTTLATINWSTSPAGDSQVEYGTSTAYGTLTPTNSAQVTSHTVQLNGLNPATLYHYRVRSSNANGLTI